MGLGFRAACAEGPIGTARCRELHRGSGRIGSRGCAVQWRPQLDQLGFGVEGFRGLGLQGLQSFVAFGLGAVSSDLLGPPRDLSREAFRLSGATLICNIGALIIRIGFWGPLTIHKLNKEPPK